MCNWHYNIFPMHTVEAYGVWRCGSTHSYHGHLMPQLLQPPANHWVSPTAGLVTSEQKNILTLPGFLWRSPRSLVTMVTELSRIRAAWNLPLLHNEMFSVRQTATAFRQDPKPPSQDGVSVLCLAGRKGCQKLVYIWTVVLKLVCAYPSWAPGNLSGFAKRSSKVR